MGGSSRALVGITCFLQMACAAAIIVITAVKLHSMHVTWNKATYQADVSNTCLLGKMSNGGNLCYLSYMAGGLSLVATGILSILQCCTCHLCGLGTILDSAFAAAGTVMWAVVGIIFNEYNKAPAMADVPLPEWRLSITVLSFAACGFFGLMALFAVYSLLSACCCSCCNGGNSGRTYVYRDMEKGHYGQGQGQFMAR